jgi:hypothetical protein
MEKYEYKTLKFETKGFTGGDLDTEKFDLELNKMGEAGWCLVSCFDTNQTQGSSRLVVSVFKRLVSS